MAVKKVRVVQYGCGPIGCRIVQYALERPGLELVGAVDVDPGKAGRDLGEVAGVGRRLGLAVSADAGRLLDAMKPDVVIHATGSKLERVFDQLAGIVRAGASVVSTCEELSYPWRKHPRLSAELDRLARDHGVTVLATGVNPGFLMDAWPLFMSGVCKEVHEVRVSRIQDASSRRVPFQQKIGAGLTPEEFRRKVEGGDFGHVGLPESAAMIAAGLGWELERIEETIEPVIARQAVRSEALAVPAGRAAGIRQTALGYRQGRAVISMEFQAAIGEPESYDQVAIVGVPNLTVRIPGGTHGDVATTSIVLNAVPRVAEAPPGLLTMKDLPVVACAAG
jgi:4-hydroxy-tetrahydrodipicolinate reductase